VQRSESKVFTEQRTFWMERKHPCSASRRGFFVLRRYLWTT